MSFKVGDKVRRKVEYRGINRGDWRNGDEVCTVLRSSSDSVILDGVAHAWDPDRFDLVPAEVNVSNEVQLPGIPDGYRAVRFGKAKEGDWYVGANGNLQQWNVGGQSAWNYLIVEPITPPEPAKPKTRSVVLNRYLVWDEDTPCSHRVIVAEEGYVMDNWQNFTLLGHSETIEVEVQV